MNDRNWLKKLRLRHPGCDMTKEIPRPIEKLIHSYDAQTAQSAEFVPGFSPDISLDCHNLQRGCTPLKFWT
jgi:hypothetical protein